MRSITVLQIALALATLTAGSLAADDDGHVCSALTYSGQRVFQQVEEECKSCGLAMSITRGMSEEEVEAAINSCSPKGALPAPAQALLEGSHPPGMFGVLKKAWTCDALEATYIAWDDFSGGLSTTMKSAFLHKLTEKVAAAKLPEDKQGDAANFVEQEWSEELGSTLYSCVFCMNDGCCKNVPNAGVGEAFFKESGILTKIDSPSLKPVRDTLEFMCKNIDIGSLLTDEAARAVEEKAKLEQAKLKQAEQEQLLAAKLAKAQEAETAEAARVEEQKRIDAEFERAEKARAEREAADLKAAEAAEAARLQAEKALQALEAQKAAADQAEQARLAAEVKRLAAIEADRAAAEVARLREAERAQQAAIEAEKARVAEVERMEAAQRAADARALQVKQAEIARAAEANKAVMKEAGLPESIVGITGDIPIPSHNPVAYLTRVEGSHGDLFVIRPMGDNSNVRFDNYKSRSRSMDKASDPKCKTYHNDNQFYLQSIYMPIRTLQATQGFKCMAVGHTSAVGIDGQRDSIENFARRNRKESWCYNRALKQFWNEPEYQTLQTVSEKRAENTARWLNEMAGGRNVLALGAVGVGARFPPQSAVCRSLLWPQSQGELCRRVEIWCTQSSTIPRRELEAAMTHCDCPSRR